MIPADPHSAGACHLDWPLMRNNISRCDLDAVIELLRGEDPPLTHGPQVREFEREWSDWIGRRYSVYVNSGASANLLTLAALAELHGVGEVIVPPLTWVSDIAAVLQQGFRPVFVDINPRTLGMDSHQVLRKLNDETKAVFLTHVLGLNALDRELLQALEDRRIVLIEDVCESYGATWQGRKLGTFGWAANFSFYYAHHLTTVEGGMVSTDDRDVYELLRMLRSHGMVRELSSEEVRRQYVRGYPDLNPEFIFAFPGYNMRPTEIAAVIGRSQLRRLDENNRARVRNFAMFLENLDPRRYRTDFAVEGNCNYAFTLVLQEPDEDLCARVMAALRRHGVEFRRGTAGGGNQLRQPYLKRHVGDEFHRRFPRVEHIHFFGFYIGNYPGLPAQKVLQLCKILNDL